MSLGQLKIRAIKREDFDAVVQIDSRVFGSTRPEYYEKKFSRTLEIGDRMVTSMVAEVEGRVVGYVMCDLYLGEYGISSTGATIDTIGIHPDYQRTGIGRMLMKEAINYLKKAGVVKINTLVEWDDANMVPFFSAFGFYPSPRINLEMNS